VLTDAETGEEIIAMNNIAPGVSWIEPLDSLLSEAAVLGFEYGYSTADPITLVVWEAQFGDFANAGQVIIDNFISSSYAKWGLPCNIVMMLPHGQEGQGPEHSSARLERFLTLCAEDNMIVCNPTTPAQLFHLLRRQSKQHKKRPLVIMTPKSLLRLPEAKSYKRDFIDQTFMEIIDDVSADKLKTERILLTSGKVYYDLSKYRDAKKISNTAIVRLEQYYPYNALDMRNVLQEYKNAKEVVWVQEEPANMGAWGFLSLRLKDSLRNGQRLYRLTKEESSSPAPGSLSVHIETQEALIADSFAPLSEPVF
jgi:2-oxoglutarate dehydrogenase E1 component